MFNVFSKTSSKSDMVRIWDMICPEAKFLSNYEHVKPDNFMFPKYARIA